MFTCKNYRGEIEREGERERETNLNVKTDLNGADTREASFEAGVQTLCNAG